MAGNNNELEIEEGNGGSKKKLIIIIIAAVVLVGGGIAGFFMFMNTPPETAPEASANTAGEVTEQVNTNSVDMGTALYVAMPRPFVFNLPGANRDRLVQIRVQLMVRGDKSEEMAKQHIPLIEGTLFKTFSNTNVENLSTTVGKEALKMKALQNVQIAMNEVVGQKTVEHVLFTGFVMQ